MKPRRFIAKSNSMGSVVVQPMCQHARKSRGKFDNVQRPDLRIRLERPSLRRQREFLAAVRRSRSLHGRWVAPPASAPAYRAYLVRTRRPNQEVFFVIDRATNRLAGVVNVSEIVRGNFQSAYLGYYAFTPHAGHGLMKEGLALVLDAAFGRLRLHRVEANIQPDNTASAALARALGFRLEGRSPRYLKVARVWRDHDRWALLAEEWQARRRATTSAG